MNNKLRIGVAGSFALGAALLLGACGVIAAPSAPAYGQDGSGGMMGGGMMGGGMMGGGMMGGGMMGGYGYSQSVHTLAPTPFGATPVPVDEEIQITAVNFRFSTTEITVKPGERVRFVVNNKDPYLHNFGSEDASIPFVNLPGNSTQTVTWTAPLETGTYTAVCTLHPGMSISIIIKK